MRTKLLSLIGLLAIGAGIIHASQGESPKMNGKLRVTTLSPEEIRYTGKPYIKELGAYAFNCRNYDPETSRWTTSDPSGFPDGANIYSYVNNQLTSALDADGLSKQLVSQGNTDFHNTTCAGWPNNRGDGSDWIAWYTVSSASIFNTYLTNPTSIGNLALQLVSKLGLTIDPNSSTWTAYGGNLVWSVYKDVGQTNTTWYFDYTATDMKQCTRTKTTESQDVSFTPSHNTAELLTLV